jgi:hypothetical protein
MAKINAQIIKGFNFRKIESELKRALPMSVNAAAAVVIQDIKRGISGGRDIKGKPFKKLKAGTIHSKAARGSDTPRIALSDTGMMKNVYRKVRATQSKPQAIIIPPKKRAEIALYHQKGTRRHKVTAGKGKAIPLYTSTGQLFFRKSAMAGPVPKREWFGISIKAKEKCQSTHRRVVGDVLRRVWYGR